MALKRSTLLALGFLGALGLAGCGGGSLDFGSLPFSGGGKGTTVVAEDGTVVDTRTDLQQVDVAGEQVVVEQLPTRRVFGGGRGASVAGAQVNKYIWNAALDVLSFLPVQSADPFTGVILTGYGTPPGGGRAYRATIHVTDPALDARTLNLSIYTRSGPANAETVRAVEDAILTRARQLRSGAAKL